MRHRWLHVGAACVGLAMAAVVVVLVFQRADREGSATSGDAPTTAQRQSGARDCAGRPPEDTGDAAAIADAERHLPAILNAREIEVRVTDARQRAWFARANAALGGCADEIVVYPRAMNVSVTFPASVSGTDLDAYVYGFLQRAFEPPLARSRLTIEVTSEGDDPRAPKRLVITSGAWNGFLQTRGAIGVPASIDGLRRAKRSIGYTDRELRFEHW